MPRGGHRHGYNWGIPEEARSKISIPTEIKEEVVEYAQQLWEERKKEKEDEEQSLPSGDERNIEEE